MWFIQYDNMDRFCEESHQILMDWVVLPELLRLYHHEVLARSLISLLFYQYYYNVKIRGSNDCGLTNDNLKDEASKRITFDYCKMSQIDNNNENNIYTFIFKRIVKHVLK